MSILNYFCRFLIGLQCLDLICSQNILLIMVDDLRPALGCYGDRSAYTPNIDAIAADGIVFNRAYSQQALCAPSRNSLLTSRRPDTLHLYDFYSYWRTAAGNFTTLPQFFKENGYVTQSIGKVFHPGISSNYNDDQPYSWTEMPYHPPTEIYKNYPVCWNISTGSYRRNLICPVVPENQPGGTLPDIQSLNEAKSFLQQTHLFNKPFFLAVGFHKPHVPLKYPVEYLDYHPFSNVTLPKNRFPSYGLPDVAWNPWTDIRERDDIASLNLKFPFQIMPDIWSKLIIRSYYAAVSYIDDLIGQLMETLVVEGLLEDTIIALIGDHGWSLGEHGEWSKFSNFEVAVNVPFILNIPEYRSNYKKNLEKLEINKKSDDLVELVDLFPTLVELAGFKNILQCPKISKYIMLCTEGISLVPLIDSIMKNDTSKKLRWKRGAFSQYPRPGLTPTKKPNSDKPQLKNIKIMGYTIRTEQYRYTEWVKFKSLAQDWSTVYSVELYDHFIDSEENLNLADRAALSNIKQMLSKQLRAGWKKSLPYYF